jgi:hypothetical protein
MSDNIAQEVMDEILDPEFDEMTHGNKHSYSAGCRGPLCRKAERDACARRYRARADREVKDYAPRRKAYPEEWLQEMIDWHRAERVKIGKFRSLREYYGLKEGEQINTPVLTTVQ